MASWEPTVTKLPIYGQRGVSSDDWKFIINEIYTKLNALKVNNFGNTPPVADTGELWYDNRVGENQLKVKTPAGWTGLIFDGFLGTAAYADMGNKFGDVVGVIADDKLPAIDGSNVTNVNAERLQNRSISYESTPFGIPVADAQGILDANYFPSTIGRTDSSSGITGNRPINPVIGFMYFDTTINKPVWYTGVKWVYADGTNA